MHACAVSLTWAQFKKKILCPHPGLRLCLHPAVSQYFHLTVLIIYVKFSALNTTLHNWKRTEYQVFSSKKYHVRSCFNRLGVYPCYIYKFSTPLVKLHGGTTPLKIVYKISNHCDFWPWFLISNFISAISKLQKSINCVGYTFDVKSMIVYRVILW